MSKMKETSPSYTQQAEDVMKSQRAILDSLAQLRAAEFQARQGAEQKKQELVELTRTKMIALHNNPKFTGMVDPISGKSNKEWVEMVMENEIQQDEEVVEALGEFYKAQQELGELQAALQVEVDRLGATRGWLQVLAALITQAAGDEV